MGLGRLGVQKVVLTSCLHAVAILPGGAAGGPETVGVANGQICFKIRNKQGRMKAAGPVNLTM